MMDISMEETAPVRIRIRKRRYKRRSKRRYIWCIGIVLPLLLMGTFTCIGYQSYTRDASLAQAAIQHLQKAEELMKSLPAHQLDSNLLGQAQSEFKTSLPMLMQLQTDIHSLPSVSTAAPFYGTRLTVAAHLVSLAIAAAQGGIASCVILNSLGTWLHNSIHQKDQGFTEEDISALDHGLSQMKSSLATVLNEAHQIPLAEAQFSPSVVKLLSGIHTDAPILQDLLANAEQFLSVAPIVLGIGTPTNYLMELLDSTEMRPEGGFIGNYGIVTISGGHLTGAHITDVDLLDKPFLAGGNKMPFPPQYKWFNIVTNWSLRDAGLEADFPTVAAYSERNYKIEGGTVPIQGVIAITPSFIQNALTVTGPVAVPEYHETITAQNLIARIHYHQLGAAGEGSDRVASSDGYSSLRKHFTALLAEHFLNQLRQISPATMPKFVAILVNAVQTKDIQIYFNSSPAQSVLHHYHIDASIQPTSGDGVFIVDANISGNKANSFITNTLNDQITIDTQGNAIHHTLLSYGWVKPGNVYGSSIYNDYVRVYAPVGSVLQSQTGWQQRGTSSNFDHQVWAGSFSLLYGQTRTITLLWSVPHAAQQDHTAWAYHYLLQKQAGTQWKLHLSVTLPTCARDIHVPSWKIPSTSQGAVLDTSLVEDINTAIIYAC